MEGLWDTIVVDGFLVTEVSDYCFLTFYDLGSPYTEATSSKHRLLFLSLFDDSPDRSICRHEGLYILLRVLEAFWLVTLLLSYYYYYYDYLT